MDRKVANANKHRAQGIATNLYHEAQVEGSEVQDKIGKYFNISYGTICVR